MSLASQVSDLATRIATEFKAIRIVTGALTSLTTTTKTSLVAAINEVNAKPTGTGGATINDTDAAGTTTTYSASKSESLLALKAPKADPTFTGTVSGITKAMVGLANVDNVADASKPVSTAQQTALNLKANLASPTFTGTVSGITKSMVGLANVDNTADTAKPVSTAQAAAIAALISDASATNATATTYSANKINSAIAAAVAGLVNGSTAALDTLKELADALGGDASFSTTIATALGLRVRVDAAQSFTAAQQLQAQDNISVYSRTQVGDPATDFVATFNAGLL